MSSIPQERKIDAEYWKKVAEEHLAKVTAEKVTQLPVSEPEQEQPKKKRKNQVLELLNLVMECCDLFYSDTGEPFATIRGTERDWTLKIRSRKFRLWLINEYLEENFRPANQTAVNQALELIEAKAHFLGNRQTLFNRVGEVDGTIYIDLGTDTGEVVRIDPGQVTITTKPPLKFQLSPHQKPLPIPDLTATPEDIGELRKLINIKDNDDWTLLVSWLLACFRPSGPFPILALQGERGSAKSTTMRILRALIDPASPPAQRKVADERDLMIHANNRWVVAMDNLWKIEGWLSDSLCTLSTGGGLMTRSLYTDDEETAFDVMRPIVLNGIAELAQRQDLMDRTITLFLPAIPEEKRMDEKTLWTTFNALHPVLFGALCKTIAEAMKEYPTVTLKKKPRLADFAMWVTAAEKAIGWKPGSFLEAFTENQEESLMENTEGNPFANSILDMMNHKLKNTAGGDYARWEGTASDLLKELEGYADHSAQNAPAWPKAHNRVWNSLQSCGGGLRKMGIEYERLPRMKAGRLIVLEYKPTG